MRFITCLMLVFLFACRVGNDQEDRRLSDTEILSNVQSSLKEFELKGSTFWKSDTLVIQVDVDSATVLQPEKVNCIADLVIFNLDSVSQQQIEHLFFVAQWPKNEAWRLGATYTAEDIQKNDRLFNSTGYHLSLLDFYAFELSGSESLLLSNITRLVCEEYGEVEEGICFDNYFEVLLTHLEKCNGNNLSKNSHATLRVVSSMGWEFVTDVPDAGPFPLNDITSFLEITCEADTALIKHLKDIPNSYQK